MRWYIGIALVAFSGVMLWKILAADRTAEISDAELATLVRRSHPQWANYQEDLKAQIGSTPVARWRGKPVLAQREAGRVLVTFELSGHWADYDFALPILMRDHLGKIRQNGRTIREGPRAVYTFTAARTDDPVAAPWIEIKYPHHQQRIAFSEAGSWAAEESGR